MADTRSDPDKNAVLAWLWADETRSASDAVTRWWPDAPPERRSALASKVRVWATRARKPEGVAPSAPPSVAPSTGAAVPEGPDMTEDREGWLESECRKLALDIEKARGSGSWPALNALSKTALAFAAELDAIRRAPAPPPTVPSPFACSTGEPFIGQPFFDAKVIEGLSPLALTLALFALARIQEGIPFTWSKEHGIPTIDPDLVEDILAEADRFGASLEELCGEEAWAPGKRSEAFETRYEHFLERAKAGELADLLTLESVMEEGLRRRQQEAVEVKRRPMVTLDRAPVVGLDAVEAAHLALGLDAAISSIDAFCEKRPAAPLAPSGDASESLVPNWQRDPTRDPHPDDRPSVAPHSRHDAGADDVSEATSAPEPVAPAQERDRPETTNERKKRAPSPFWRPGDPIPQ